MFIEYPEDIRLYGLSFNTTWEQTGIAIQGEVSYRDNVPLQIDDVEVLFTGLSPLNGLIPQPYNRFISQLGARAGQHRDPGLRAPRVVAVAVHPDQDLRRQLSSGAEQIALVGEFGGTKVWDLPDPAILRYQGDGTDTGGGPDVNTGAGRNPQTQVDGFPTQLFVGLSPRRSRGLQQRVRHARSTCRRASRSTTTSTAPRRVLAATSSRTASR